LEQKLLKIMHLFISHFTPKASKIDFKRQLFRRIASLKNKYRTFPTINAKISLIQKIKRSFDIAGQRKPWLNA